jgi:N-acetylneuraminate lyase
MEPALEGIVPAVHTPFDDREELDIAAFRRLVRRLADEGVDGVFVCGTAGEFPLLTLDERERIVEAAAGEAAGRILLAVHVGAPRTRDAVRLAEHAARAGAGAISSVPPTYYAYRQDAVLGYVRDVATASPLPFLYYHIPERTGVEIDDAFIERLLAIPGVKGIKFSDGDMAFAERILKVAAPDFRLFCGCDGLLLDALERGAAGGIGSTYNFLAPLFLDVRAAFLAGSLAAAREIQARANRILAALAPYPVIAAGKEAMRLAGIAAGLPRQPLERLTDGERASLRRDLAAAGWSPAATAG